MSFLVSAAIVLLVATGLVLLTRANLRQRPEARRLRAIFIAAANDLVGKAEFPDAHARQLVEAAVIPGGWMVRGMLFLVLRQMVTGRQPKRRADAPSIEQVPPQLRIMYVTAILALVLSDSYRCVILGRIWRAAYPWIEDALKEVKPDVNAHATRVVVQQMATVHAPRHLNAVQQRLEAVPA